VPTLNHSSRVIDTILNHPLIRHQGQSANDSRGTVWTFFSFTVSVQAFRSDEKGKTMTDAFLLFLQNKTFKEALLLFVQNARLKKSEKPNIPFSKLSVVVAFCFYFFFLNATCDDLIWLRLERPKSQN